MKSLSAILVLAVVAFVIAVAPMAWAADVVQGKIKSVDPSGQMVTLDNGTKLTIPPTLTVEEKSALKPGANVRASYEEKAFQRVWSISAGRGQARVEWRVLLLRPSAARGHPEGACSRRRLGRATKATSRSQRSRQSRG